MTSIADGAVTIQTSSESVPSPPSWFGEIVLMAAHLRKHDVLTRIKEQVRFARRRFGRYDVIDFLAVLFGYAITYEVLLSYGVRLIFLGQKQAIFFDGNPALDVPAAEHCEHPSAG